MNHREGGEGVGQRRVGRRGRVWDRGGFGGEGGCGAEEGGREGEEKTKINTPVV